MHSYTHVYIPYRREFQWTNKTTRVLDRETTPEINVFVKKRRTSFLTNFSVEIAVSERLFPFLTQFLIGWQLPASQTETMLENNRLEL